MNLTRIADVLRVAVLDRAVLWDLATRILGAATGLITALIVAHTFSPTLQGFHYTFLSLLSLQIFLELGLSGIITTFSNHEWAFLGIDKDGRVVGDPRALSRLFSLVKFAMQWFATAGVAISIILICAGYYFLSTARSDDQVQWLGPWIALSLLTGANLIVLPIWAILRGCNQVADINFFRFIDGFFRAGAVWITILLGAGLWSTPIASLTGFILSAFFLWLRYRRFLTSVFLAPSGEAVRWKEEILPLQWRIALTWLSGYFVFSLFTPALFYFQGPVVAGQMGMTWAFVTGIGGIAGTWMHTRATQFGALVANKEYAKLDSVVRQAGLIGFGVACLGGLVLLGIVIGLDTMQNDFRHRLLPLGTIAVFVFAEALHQLPIALACYLRAFKREPFLLIGLTNGMFVGASTIIFAKYNGAMGVAIAYLLGIILATVWGSMIFVRCRLEWTQGE